MAFNRTIPLTRVKKRFGHRFDVFTFDSERQLYLSAANVRPDRSAAQLIADAAQPLSFVWLGNYKPRPNYWINRLF